MRAALLTVDCPVAAHSKGGLWGEYLVQGLEEPGFLAECKAVCPEECLEECPEGCLAECLAG